MCHTSAPSLIAPQAFRPSPPHSSVRRKLVTQSVVSQNVRGLKSNDRIDELFYAMLRRKVFAACLQETWRCGVETLKYDNCTLILAGLDPIAVHGNRGYQGVGIALSPEATLAWKDAGSIAHTDLGSRVVAVRLMIKDCQRRDVGLFFISAYAPVGVADQKLWEDFFNNLEQCIARKPHDDILLVGCDANSSMGCSRTPGINHIKSLGGFGLPHCNASGKRFFSFLEINNMLALTTFFRKKHYATWIHPRSKLMHQIDHFLTSKSQFHRFLDAGITESLIDSDHRAIRCKVIIMLRLKKCDPPRQSLLRLDYMCLKNNEIAKSFCDNVVENRNTLPSTLPCYTRLATAVQKSALELLPKMQRVQPGWFMSAEETLPPLVNERVNCSSFNVLSNFVLRFDVS